MPDIGGEKKNHTIIMTLYCRPIVLHGQNFGLYFFFLKKTLALIERVGINY
jgi:hypothetical protein